MRQVALVKELIFKWRHRLFVGQADSLSYNMNRIVLEQMLSQTPGIAVSGVGNPRFDGDTHCFQGEVAILIGFALIKKTAHKTTHIAAPQAAVGWEKYKAAKVNPDVGWKDNALLGVQHQAQALR